MSPLGSWRVFLLIPLLLTLAGCGGGSGSSVTPPGPPSLVSIAVAPANSSVTVGETLQFTATGTYSDGSTQNLTNSATWSSSSTSDATIQSAGQATPGMATGVATGSVTITAALSGVSGTTTLSVENPTITSISVSPASTSVAVGATQQFTATAQYSNNTTQNVTNSAAWSSSASPATVETTGQANPGLASGVTAGSTTITATYNGQSGAATLLVASGSLPSLFVGPSSANVVPAGTQQFTATETLVNGTTQNVTSSASWTSSNTTYATVESTGAASPGLATGVAIGSATITATYSGLTATSTLNVETGQTAMIPLIDMTPSQNYLGFSGGLYGNGSNTIPSAQNAAGLTFASQIQPLDANGNPSATGSVVLISIGMSNAADEFGQFIGSAAKSSSVNHTTLVIANGAKGGITACYWTVANGPVPCGANTANQFDRVLTEVLTPLRVTEQQVEVLWLKEANGGPGVTGCGSGGYLPCNSLCNTSVAGCSNTPTTTEALRYEMQMGEIIRAAKTRWPNLKLAFLTSRVYAGYATVDVNPEPYAYEYGFSVQWFIQAQVNQIATGTVDPVAGDLNYNDGIAPWLAWGPYIWANGSTPSSDGLAWCDGQTGAPCDGEVDYQSDGTHPDTLGQAKVGYGVNTITSIPAQSVSTSSPTQNLLHFFLNSPYTKAWFAVAP